MNEAANTLFKFNSVSVTLGGNKILDKVNATVPKGSCTAIVGPNGAGKTTLLLTLLKKVSYKGEITFYSPEKKALPRIAYVPQKLQIDTALPMTVLEFMVSGQQRVPFWFGVRTKLKSRAMELLKSVHMESVANRRLGALSGGEMQRVLLALALAQKPELLVLDEPSASVDIQGDILLCELMDKFRKELGFTQLMVSHDLGTVSHHATHVICLNRRVVAEGNASETLTHENLAAIFGLHMGLAQISENCCTKAHLDA